jgi:hypothetical protein
MRKGPRRFGSSAQKYDSKLGRRFLGEHHKPPPDTGVPPQKSEPKIGVVTKMTAHGSLNSPAYSCVSIHVASRIINVDHTGAALATSVTSNADKVWVVYQKNMRKTMLLTGCALLLGTTVIAGDFAADPLNFRNPQQDLIDNPSEMLPEMKELQSCEKQQEEALQRFLEAGLSLNAAALMAHNQYPCDSTDQ